MRDAFKNGRVALRNHVSCSACEKATVHPETADTQKILRGQVGKVENCPWHGSELSIPPDIWATKPSNVQYLSGGLGAQGRPPVRHGS